MNRTLAQLDPNDPVPSRDAFDGHDAFRKKYKAWHERISSPLLSPCHCHLIAISSPSQATISSDPPAFSSSTFTIVARAQANAWSRLCWHGPAWIPSSPWGASLRVPHLVTFDIRCTVAVRLPQRFHHTSALCIRLCCVLRSRRVPLALPPALLLPRASSLAIASPTTAHMTHAALLWQAWRPSMRRRRPSIEDSPSRAADG